MNTKFLFLVLGVAALSGCSTAYKTGQTPDDVYFSPAKPQQEYASVENEEDSYLSTDRNPRRYDGRQRVDNYDTYDNFDSYRNDRMLRMSIGNRMRLSAFDDYYMYDGFSNWRFNNYAYNFNTPWNSYYYWNSFYNPYNRFNFYNPYYGNVYAGSVKSPSIPISRPRLFTPGGYTDNSFTNSNLYLYKNAAPVSGTRPSNTNSRYNNRNSNSNLGNTMRKIFSAPNESYYDNSNSNRSSNNNSYTPPSRSMSSEAPVRSYNPGNSSSGSSGGSSGGGGGVSRPTRGGN